MATKKTIERRLAELKTLSVEELDQLDTDIRADYEDAEKEDDTERMELRVAQVESVIDRLDEISAQDESDEDEDEDEDNVDPEEMTSEDEDEDVETSKNTKAKAATTTDKEGETAMAASADFDAPADRQPVAPLVASTKVLSGSDIPGFSAGREFNTLDEVSAAFVQRLQSTKRTRGGDGEQHTVASVVASIPEDRMLAPGDIEGNSAKIEAVTGEGAIVASGGFCAPLPVRYDIFGMGVTDRPIRSSLPVFGATRGGIRYVAPPRLGNYSDAIDIWTAANDADPGSDGPETKPCLKVDCAEELEAVTHAITLCLEFGNLMTRAFPELVARHNQLALVQHARFAELSLLQQMGAHSMATTSSFKLGVARDFLLAIGKAAAAYRNRHRVSRTMPLRVVAPEWVLDAMREDIAQGLPGDRLAEADSVITGYLAARNVNITWHMDDLFADQTPGALVDFPSTIKWYIFAEGTFLLLDGGTLDLGIIRDSELVGTNDYKTFTESFEGLAKVGLESVQVTTTTQIEGLVAGHHAAPVETPAG